MIYKLSKNLHIFGMDELLEICSDKTSIFKHRFWVPTLAYMYFEKLFFFFFKYRKWPYLFVEKTRFSESFTRCINFNIASIDRRQTLKLSVEISNTSSWNRFMNAFLVFPSIWLYFFVNLFRFFFFFKTHLTSS